MRTILIAAGLFVATVGGAALAKDKPPVFVETRAMSDKPAVPLDPAKGYILLRTDLPLSLYLTKVPTPAEQATYDALRAEALAKARKKYAKKLATYEKTRAAAREVGVAPPERPVEPTEDNFDYPAFSMIAAVQIGPLQRFAKGDGGRSTYLQEITPGTYRIYGLIFVGPSLTEGTCFCMGSVTFEVRPGVLTDLGFSPSMERWRAGQPAASTSAAIADAPFLMTTPADVPGDPRLELWTTVPARFVAAGKVPNHLGVMIGRIPPMPGVIGYDRDRILDLSAR